MSLFETSLGEYAAKLIGECETKKSKLTVWEINFIRSFSRSLHYKPPSDKQIKALEKIWERVTA